MAKSAIEQISATAKQIRRKHPGKAWKACIQEASAIYRRSPAGKKIAGVKKKPDKRKIKPRQRGKPDIKRQTGESSIPHDKRMSAKQPGLRKSTAGNWYYERRKNRSDKPGSLTGVGVYAASAMQRLQKEILEKSKALTQIEKLKTLSRVKGRTAKEKAEIRKAQLYYGKIVKSCVKHIGNLKRLI